MTLVAGTLQPGHLSDVLFIPAGAMLLRSRPRLFLVLLFLLAFFIILWSGVPPAAPASAGFRDLKGHWAQGCIESLVQRQLMTGYTDGTFRPNTPVTRAEYAVTISQAFPNLKPLRSAIRFQDIASSDRTAPAIQYAYQTGFLSSYPNNRFNPKEKMVRAQALGALAAGLQMESRQASPQQLSSIFQDAKGIPGYTRSAIATALENRLIANYPDVRQLRPSQPMNRAELAAAICLAQPDTASLIPTQYIANLPTLAPPPAAKNNREIRGVWLTNVDSDVLFSPNRLLNGIQELARLNINTLYPAVWNWGYTLYPSAVAQQTFGHSVDPRQPDLADWDMLATLVQQGHSQGMTVIPWFEFGFMAPSDSELAARHPDWLTQRFDGSQIWMEGIYPRVWLNPFHPQVQQFITNLILEIVSRYNVDGIQLDDHFGLPYEFGYDPYTIRLYQQETGKVAPLNAKDPDWMRWRANKITAYMTQLFRAIKARKPNVLVTLSPNNYEFSYNHSLQDWFTWERQGLVEELLLQVYRNQLDAFVAELKKPEVVDSRQHIPTGIGILTGLKDQPVPIQQVQQQVQAVRQQGFSGVSFFFYETMWKLATEPADTRKAVFQNLFPTPSPRPDLLQGWQPPPKI